MHAQTSSDIFIVVTHDSNTCIHVSLPKQQKVPCSIFYRIIVGIVDRVKFGYTTITYLLTVTFITVIASSTSAADRVHDSVLVPHVSIIKIVYRVLGLGPE